MNSDLHIIIPFIPVATARPRFYIRKGHIHSYDKQSSKKKAFASMLNLVMKKQLVYFDGPVELELIFNIPRARSHFGTGKNRSKGKPSAPGYPTKSDIDNYCKFVMDGFSGIIWKDDRQVMKLTAEKRFADNGSIEVTVRVKG